MHNEPADWIEITGDDQYVAGVFLILATFDVSFSSGPSEG